MKNGQLVFPWCYKTYKILDNGPLRFTVELTYNTSRDGITEHRIISLDKGSHFNRMTVWYDGITQPTALAAGIVLHNNDHLLLDKRYVLYADPTDNPQVHQTQIYVGTLFPNGIDETLRLEGELPHANGIIAVSLILTISALPGANSTSTRWRNGNSLPMIIFTICQTHLKSN